MVIRARLAEMPGEFGLEVAPLGECKSANRRASFKGCQHDEWVWSMQYA